MIVSTDELHPAGGRGQYIKLNADGSADLFTRRQYIQARAAEKMGRVPDLKPRVHFERGETPGPVELGKGGNRTAKGKTRAERQRETQPRETQPIGHAPETQPQPSEPTPAPAQPSIIKSDERTYSRARTKHTEYDITDLLTDPRFTLADVLNYIDANTNGSRWYIRVRGQSKNGEYKTWQGETRRKGDISGVIGSSGGVTKKYGIDLDGLFLGVIEDENLDY